MELRPLLPVPACQYCAARACPTSQPACWELPLVQHKGRLRVSRPEQAVFPARRACLTPNAWQRIYSRMAPSFRESSVTEPSKTLIIWGMHRSGTSLLASWLHACGLHIGSELLGEGMGNERGHFEDMDFLRLHERILSANGILCGGLLKTGPLRLSPAHDEEMRELVQGKSQRRQWGWKEPRTCLFSRQYLQLLPAAYHLVVFRHYALVVDSLVRRHIKRRTSRLQRKSGFKRRYYELRLKLWQRFRLPDVINRYLAAWVKYNENLLALVEQAGPSALVLSAGDFVASSEQVFRRLQEWGFELQAVPAADCVDASMIAHTPSQDFAYDPQLKAHADAVLQRLNALAVS